MKIVATAPALILGGLVALGCLTAEASTTTQEAPAVVVGTFDSRAVAVAYVRSDAFGERLRALRAEVDAAEAAGDAELAAELAARGPALQTEVHRQSFGTAPVDEIVALIEDELPAIAAAAGVDVIVSKWVLAYRGPRARFVDVTDLLAAEFDPDPETLEVIQDLVAMDPVPLEQLDGHDH
jgi:hypothetical protein